MAVFTARTSVTLLGYAALPWLLLCVHRGLRAPRSWWWPAAFALVVACTGGGVNAAVTGVGAARAGAARAATSGWSRERRRAGACSAFGWRTALLTALGAVWWVVPTLVQARHGVDFLRFTEQPGTIWSTTSLPESLRLMGYWISYLGVGYGGRLRPLFGDGGVLLFSWPVVLAGLLVPALALTGFALARRSRYGAVLPALALVGLLVMVAGFPEGTPLRRAMNFTYNHVAPLQFLRTTYKAGPLLALGIACLAGVAAAGAAPWLRRRARWAPAAALACVAVLAAVACWPLVRGPGARLAAHLGRGPAGVDARRPTTSTGRSGRTAARWCCPGQLYAYYDWGGTVDAILPALAERPVAVRYAVPYADLRAVDLLWTVDGLVQQRRALPGQLGPLLDLMGARTVVAGADDDRSRSGAVAAADAADVLDQLGPPDEAWGPVRARAAGGGDARARPAGCRGCGPGTARRSRPLVRVEGDGGATVVDGSAEGLAGLAAFGALPEAGGSRYAGDLPARARCAGARRGRDLRLQPAAGAGRRADGAEPRRDAGRRRPVLARRGGRSTRSRRAAPTPRRSRATTASATCGRRSRPPTRSSPSGGRSRRSTATRDPLAGRPRARGGRGTGSRSASRRRATWTSIELLPYSDRRAPGGGGRGRRAGGSPCEPGWNRLRARAARRALAAGADGSVRERRRACRAAAGGIRELRIPGVRPREALRPPVLAERALAGRDLVARPA